jgi:hypothetical protein
VSVQKVPDFGMKIRRYALGFHLFNQSGLVCMSLANLALLWFGVSSLLSGRTYGSVRRDLTNRVYATDEARSYAISKAEDLEQELDSSFPIFIKPMTQSHVTGGFWLVK